MGKRAQRTCASPRKVARCPPPKEHLPHHAAEPIAAYQEGAVIGNRGICKDGLHAPIGFLRYRSNGDPSESEFRGNHVAWWTMVLCLHECSCPILRPVAVKLPYHIRPRIAYPPIASIFQARPRDVACARSTKSRSCGLELYLGLKDN